MAGIGGITGLRRRRPLVGRIPPAFIAGFPLSGIGSVTPLRRRRPLVGRIPPSVQAAAIVGTSVFVARPTVVQVRPVPQRAARAIVGHIVPQVPPVPPSRMVAVVRPVQIPLRPVRPLPPSVGRVLPRPVRFVAKVNIVTVRQPAAPAGRVRIGRIVPQALAATLTIRLPIAASMQRKTIKNKSSGNIVVASINGTDAFSKGTAGLVTAFTMVPGDMFDFIGDGVATYEVK
jgi:hypothetical protein